MSNGSKRPFFRRMERWLVGSVMAVMAYMLEKAVLRSIRRGRGRLPEQGPTVKSESVGEGPQRRP
ncbi:MAG: hypothetical protein WA624_04375 [Methylocella sp.]